MKVIHLRENIQLPFYIEDSDSQRLMVTGISFNIKDELKFVKFCPARYFISTSEVFYPQRCSIKTHVELSYGKKIPIAYIVYYGLLSWEDEHKYLYLDNDFKKAYDCTVQHFNENDKDKDDKDNIRLDDIQLDYIEVTLFETLQEYRDYKNRLKNE